MDKRIELIRGIHPGKIIKRDIRRKKLNQRILAEATNIPYQTINAIIQGKRNLTTEQALKIERILCYQEGFLAVLQTYYEIKQHKDEELSMLYKGIPSVRMSLFWDTDFGKMNWAKYKNAVIKRVLERGNLTEIKEISRFYHLSADELLKLKTSPEQIVHL